MSFPSNPSIGDIHTSSGNGLKYQFTPKRVWKLVRTNGSSTTGSQFNYTASVNPPTSPALGDQWFDENVSILKSWGYDGQSYSWISISGGDSEVVNNYTSASDVVLPLMWLYGTAPFSFELWSDDENYTWINIDSTIVATGLAGDDSLTVASTVGFKAGGNYVLYNDDGSYIQRITILSVLNNTVLRLVADLNINIGADDKFYLGRTSAARHTGGAIFKNNDIYIGKFITPITTTGQLILRRSSTGTGVFTAYYRLSGATQYVQMDLNQTLAVGTDYRDEYYNVPVGGSLQFMLVYNGTATETVYYMVGLPSAQTVDANRVQQPVNVYPTDQTVNVSTTPTLLGSPFTSIYGLAENGAEFRIASDKAFKNILVSSSTDFLSSFTRITGQTASFTGFVFYSGRKGVAVGAGGTILTTTDGGNTYATSTPAINVDLADIAYNGSNTLLVVGASGSLQYSTNFGATWTAGNASDGYTGQLNGVASFGNFGIAVGANGEILRTTTSGQIWQRVSPDNSYTGTFYGVACDNKGNYVAVGSNGEIQFSADNGFTWSHRPNSGNFTGNFREVAMDNNGNVLAVGDNGMIQYSGNYANNWSTKAADNAYTGSFYDVSLVNGFACVVGANAEIQSSKNGGLNWVHRAPANAETRSFTTVALTSDNYGLILGATGAAQKGVKLEGATTSYAVPAGSDLLAVNKLYYWQCRYQDQSGFWSLWSTPTIFSTAATINAVVQPSNLSPANGAMSVPTKPTLQCSTFKYSGSADTQTASNWQLASDAFFSNIIYDSGDTTDFASHTVPSANPTVPLVPLASGSTYYWRVRQKGTISGYSSFSAATSFVVSQQATQPVISTPTNNSSVYGDNLALTIATFSSTVANDKLQDTQFQLDTTLAFSAPITLDAGQALTTTVPAGTLKQSTTYYLRARTKGTLTDYSQWSSVVVITTRVNAPIGEAVFVSTDGKILNSFFTVPDNIYSVSYVAIGTGGTGGSYNLSYPTNRAKAVTGGGGGGLVYGTATVTPRDNIGVIAGAISTLANPIDSSTGDTSNFAPGANGVSSSFGTFGTATGGGGGGGGYLVSHFNGGSPYNTLSLNVAITLTQNTSDGTIIVNCPGGTGGTYSGGTGGGTGGAGGSMSYNEAYDYIPCAPGGGGAAGYSGAGGYGASVSALRTKAQSFDYSMIIPASPGQGGGGAGGYTSIPFYPNYALVNNGVAGGSTAIEGGYGGGTGIYGKGANGQPSGYNDGGPGSIDQGDLRNYGGGSAARFYDYGRDGGFVTTQSGQNQGGSAFSTTRIRRAYLYGAVRVIWGQGRSFPSNAM